MKKHNNWIEHKGIVELSEMLKAIAHPSRVAIMALLCNSGDKRMTVKSIYNELEMSQPIISRHLGILKDGRLIKRVVEGQNTFYELNKINKYVNNISKCFSSLMLNN